jgi:phosphoglycerate kinase
MDKITVRDVEVGGKRVLVRVDFNVPLDEANGKTTDDSRIKATLPTIRYLIENGARTILCSHLGRPEGKMVEKLRMLPVARRLSQLLGKEVITAGDCIGPIVEQEVEKLTNGDVLLLENLRFHPSEEDDGNDFAKALSRLADIYVNDAFGVSHRTHASIVGITQYLPTVAGLLVEKELNTLGGILESPVHPFAVLIGGAKVGDKIGLLKNTMSKVDCLLIGGGMATTFLKAKSYEIGLSSIEVDKLDMAAGIIEKAERNGVRLLLPVDVIVAYEINGGTEIRTVILENIPSNMSIVDIGPQTIENFSLVLKQCKTIFWNGPMGVYEIPQFAEGTISMARLLAGLDVTTIIGGGSTAEVVTELEISNKMSFVSTGGGASLRFLGGKTLPGVEVIPNKEL